MAIYTLEHFPEGGGSTTRELGGSQQPGDPRDGWGFSVARRVDRSLAADTVELRIVPDRFDSPEEPRENDGVGWRDGDQVVIYRDGVRWFAGEVRNEKRSAGPGRHTIGWEVVGPWQAMEELTYVQFYGMSSADEQDPPQLKTEYVERGDVVLMQEFDPDTGNYQVLTTGQQIKALADFAADRAKSKGGDDIMAVADMPGSTGNSIPIDPGIYIDFVEATDETVANLIRRLARWTPKAVGWFDYSTSPPTFHFNEPEGTVNIDLRQFEDEDRIDMANSDIDIRPNHELVVPYVKIAYISTDQVEVEGATSSYAKVEYDQFPDPYSGVDHRKALRATVPLQGATAQIQVQRVGTRTIPLSDDGSNYGGTGPLPENERPGSPGWNDKVRDFCAGDDRLPWLKYIVPTGDLGSNIGVVNFKVAKMEVDDAIDYPEGEEPPTYDLSETPRVLEEGATSEWMNVKSQKVKITARLIFKGGSIKSKNVRKYFNTGSHTTKDGRSYPYVDAEWTVVATSAVSKSYERTTSQTEAEERPQGIAAHIYGQLEALRYTGSITVSADELPLLKEDGTLTADPNETRLNVNPFHPGMQLNIINSLYTDWSSMETPIQEVSQNVEDRTITFRIGAPEQLGIQDFVTLARLWRDNPPSFTNEEERSLGAAKSDGKTEGGENTPTIGDASNVPAADPNPLMIKCGPKANADGIADPTVGWEFTVNPGWVTSERAIVDGGPNPAMYTPHMPKMDGLDRLDAENIPSMDAIVPLTVVWAKHNFSDDGLLESVYIESGATMPANDGEQGSAEHWRMGQIEIEADDNGVLQAVVTQDVESNYYWPTKQKTDGEGGQLTNKTFYLMEEVLDETSNCIKLKWKKYSADFTNMIDLEEEKETDLATCDHTHPDPDMTQIEVSEVTYIEGDPTSDCGSLQINKRLIDVPTDSIGANPPAPQKPSFLLCATDPLACSIQVQVAGSTLSTEVDGTYDLTFGTGDNPEEYTHENNPTTNAVINKVTQGWNLIYDDGTPGGNYAWSKEPDTLCATGTYICTLFNGSVPPDQEPMITVTAVAP